MTPEERAAENRRKFPGIAEVVDQLRSEGNTVRLLWAENDQGDQVGRRRELGEES